MGLIGYQQRGMVYPLAARTLVGRAPHCPIRLHEGFISREHAVLAYQSGSYWVKALSAGGTQVQSRTLDAGDCVPLARGETLVLGRGIGAVVLVLTCDSAPLLIAHELNSGSVVAAEPGQTLKLCSSAYDAPLQYVEVAFDAAAGAKIVRSTTMSATQPLRNEQVLQVGASTWMLHLPSDDKLTANLDSRAVDLRDCRLCLTTDAGGDFVAVSLRQQSAGQSGALGGERQVASRSRYAATLLALAEKKRQDLAEGIPERCAGWVTNDELRTLLGCRPGRDENLPYLHPFRIKRLFEAANVRGLDHLFERDHGSIRLGLSDFEIAVE